MTPEPPPGVGWAEVTFGEATDFTWPDGTVTKFQAGEVVPAFPAEQIASAGTTEVLRRFYRRPLTDGQTQMLGADAITERVGNQEPVTVFDNLQTLGLYRIRQDLERALENSEARTEALRGATQNATSQLALLDEKKGQLTDDQRGWEQDLQAAERIEASVQQRHDAIAAELRETEEAIVQLGTTLRRLTANVTAEIDRRAPAPDILEAPPAAGAAVQ